MAEPQDLFTHPSPEDELGEIEREKVLNERVHRLLWLVVDEEIGRKQMCWVLQMSEGELSKRLTGAENKRPCFRMLMYALEHEQSGRLAKLVMAQARYAPPVRPDKIDDAEFRRRTEDYWRLTGPAGAAERAYVLGEARPVRKVGVVP